MPDGLVTNFIKLTIMLIFVKVVVLKEIVGNIKVIPPGIKQVAGGNA